MGRKVKVIKDTSLIPVNVSSGGSVCMKSSESSMDSFLNTKIDNEIERATAKEDSLQQQIDNLRDKGFSVKDVVNTYEDLLSYDTSYLLEDDVIVVLNDSEIVSGKVVSSFYRWNKPRFSCLGASSYTVNEVDRLITDLQNQISYLGSKSAIRDVVSTYSDLQAYDTSSLVTGDIIAVLKDESKNNASTYYKKNDLGLMVLYGSLGPTYYTREELDAKFHEVNLVLENHEVRITENREDIDNRISQQDAYDILVGE